MGAGEVRTPAVAFPWCVASHGALGTGQQVLVSMPWSQAPPLQEGPGPGGAAWPVQGA